ncbi:hypothetical protein KJY73_14550 [Bowmanella sp. Y26]|uniref:hypothetical protein n=1 Tax=Bowmanella yangjiangensis TaxID=2811230 RepID=UPI001BDD6D95|nr:hypothetical protein [Bowmanella yangjiangensis]MBT1064809.1 hypothetical protein [Bowmanella yangjiangensis]
MPNKDKKKKKKDSQLLIRIDKEMRNTFIELCENHNSTAARELRSFIQSYIEQHQAADKP